jgi:hypothetical protein
MEVAQLKIACYGSRNGNVFITGFPAQGITIQAQGSPILPEEALKNFQIR